MKMTADIVNMSGIHILTHIVYSEKSEHKVVGSVNTSEEIKRAQVSKTLVCNKQSWKREIGYEDSNTSEVPLWIL